MQTDDQQDRIDDYLRGRSTDPAQFERDLEQNPQLREEMEATRLALDAIAVGEDQKLKDRLRKLESELSTAAPNQDRGGARIVQLKPRKQKRWLPYAAAAAALILLFAGYFLLRPANLTGPQLAEASFTPYDNIAYTITKGGGEQDNRAAAYIAYEGDDYPAATAAFQQLASEEPADRFYLGQSLLAQQDYATALPIFQDLSEMTDFNLAEEASYYHAIALVGLDRREEAASLLKPIANDDDHPLHNEAVALFGDL